MVRPEQLLHPQREPVTARPAATMLLVRDATYKGSATIEVLMTRRSTQARFAPGAYVFPGGAVDDADTQSFAHVARRQTQSDAQVVQAIAAIRETFEELGVLLARRPDGQMVNQSDTATIDRGAPLVDQCRRQNLVLAADCAFPLAHWITDRDMPRRFDAHFLVARMPSGQTPRADESEQFDPVWVSPALALERHGTGDFAMIFPTVRTLERLMSFDSVDSLLTACGTETPLWTSCPRGGLKEGGTQRYMEQDAPFGELRLVCPDGQVSHSLDWQTTTPVPLLKNVARLTAANAGIMTGPGTNSYVVGTTDTGFIVIDPGPDNKAHLRRLHDFTGGDIRMIVCTHSHEDHAPGARPLQAMCSHVPPVLGLPSGPAARAKSHFTPDRTLLDRELLILRGTRETHRLLVVKTPGHASNHICLILLEDGLLFSGDHILNGSTSVIDPPDGNMTAYLDSLDVLDAVCEKFVVEYLLPAHGYVLGNPREQIASLKAHRLAREAKISAVIQSLPNGTVATWLKRAYDDVPANLRSAAMSSLLAHLERIQTLRRRDVTPGGTNAG